MSARQEDFVFAEHVLRRGFATEEQVQECLDLLARVRGEMSLDETLEGILLKRGYLAPAQAQVIAQAINPAEAGRSRNQIEGYRLLARLGSGAMGSVYKARHDKLDILVALKVLRVELAKSKTQVERLKREAQLAARLNHPNIVRSIDVGESNGFHYFAMEFVDGPTARNLIRESRLKEKDALRIVLAVARALEHAHGNGIIHRDVKPANIMLSRSGQVKLGDFGLARGQGPSELTLEHAAIGTPQYLAPEQAASAANATPRSDLFSLGATLYHLVTGQPPFSGDNLAEIFGRVIRADFEPPESVVDDLSIDTVYLIHRLMRPNPRDRYANATELIADLEKLDRGERVAPADFKGDYQSFLDRRRQKRTAIAAVAVVVLGASIWFTVDTIVEHRQRADALAACRLLNSRGKGELASLASLEELVGKRDELKQALDSGSDCDPDIVLDLTRRVETLKAEIGRLQGAEDALVRARARDANYRQLARQVEAIRPALDGAAARCKFIRGEIGRMSNAEARRRSAEVYVAHDDVPALIADLKKLAEDLRTRFLPVEEVQARDVAAHARVLGNLKLSYDKAREDHGPRFDAAVKDKDFDSAARQLELIRQAWSAAYERSRSLPPIFLQMFPHDDVERRDTLAKEERRAWLDVKRNADQEEKAGRPDKALAIVRKFLSGSEEFRKTAEEEVGRLERRQGELLQDQLRAVDEIERTFRGALGDRQYAAAVSVVRRHAADFAWFGEGERRFETMKARASAIEDDLIKEFLPRLRALKSVPVKQITRNPRRATAPGSAFDQAPGGDRDRFLLKIGEEQWEFGLRELDYETLRALFGVEKARKWGRGKERLAPGYFLIAESFGQRKDPRSAQKLLSEAQELLIPTGDEWIDGVNVELKELEVRIRKGEEDAKQLLKYMTEAQQSNDHDTALLLCERLLREFAWTETVQDAANWLRGERQKLRGLAGASTVARSSGIPRDQFTVGADGRTEIRYTGSAYHPLAPKVPDGVDPVTWLRPREEQLYKSMRGDPDAPGFDRYFHRAIHQLLDWGGPVDVKHPGTGEPLDPPGYVLQAKEAGAPDREWWQGTLDEDQFTILLRNHFDPRKDWSIEFTIEWAESAWFEKELVEGRAKAHEYRARIPVYFAVACGKAQGAIGYFPKRNGGVAGTRIFLAEKMSPPDAHADEFGDFHWHLADEQNRKRVTLSDRAWLDSRTWQKDVAYRVRFARLGHELHLWMAPLKSWKDSGPFVDATRTVDAWKKGKTGDFRRAVHIWLKSSQRELDGAGDFPRGTPQFRFFDRVRFTLRDVEVTGFLNQDDGKQ